MSRPEGMRNLKACDISVCCCLLRSLCNVKRQEFSFVSGPSKQIFTLDLVEQKELFRVGEKSDELNGIEK